MTFSQYIKKHDRTITLSTYLLPIFLSVIVSLAHVVTFWDIANPMSWAIFLSIAVEVGVLSSIAASRISNWVWLPFSLVTLIQIVGNIFYSYVDTSVTDPLFKSWVELSDPFFNFIGFGTDGDLIVHKRIVAMFLGSFVPLMSIMFFQFFIKSIRRAPDVTNVIDSPVVPVEPPVEKVTPVNGEFDLSHNKIPMQKDYHFPSPDHTQPPPIIDTLPEPEATTKDELPEILSDYQPPEPAIRMDHFSPITVKGAEPSEAEKAITNMTNIPREKLQQPYGMVSNEVLPVMACKPPEGMTVDREATIKKWEDAGLLNGLPGSTKSDVAKLWGNQQKWLINEPDTTAPIEPEDPNQIKLEFPTTVPDKPQDRIIVFEDEKKK